MGAYHLVDVRPTRGIQNQHDDKSTLCSEIHSDHPVANNRDRLASERVT